VDKRDIFVRVVKALFLLIIAEKKNHFGFLILMEFHLENSVINTR